MERFLESSREAEADRERAFQEAFGIEGEEQLGLLQQFGLFAWDAPLDVLEKNTQLLRELRVEELALHLVEELQQKYPVSTPLQVELYLMDEQDTFGRETLAGLSAFAEWGGRICFFLYPEENVANVLRSAVVHEYHHHWRMSALQLSEDQKTLLERVVLEGLAEHFVAHEIGKEHCGPWIHALSEVEAHDVWPLYREQQDLQQGVAPYVFGSKENGLPFWAGYSMGYHLVQWYRERHPEATMEELTLLPCKAYLP